MSARISVARAPIFRRLATKCSRASFSTVRAFSVSPAHHADATTAGKCDLHIVNSPYPPIPLQGYPPITEFVTKDWSTDPHLRDKVAIFDGSTGQRRTFGEHDSNMARIAASLKDDFNVTEDSTVALFAPNHVDYVPITLAVALCGAKMTPLNPRYTDRELGVILDKSHTDVLICHWSVLKPALSAVKDCKTVKHVITIPEVDEGSVPAGTTSLCTLQKHERSLRETVHCVHQDVVSHPFLLPYSSGTTGLPKAVCLSHSNIVANLLQFDEAEAMSFPSDHKLISPLPFYHIYGFLASALYCVWRGQQLITMSGQFDLDTFCKLVEEHKPQRAHLVPPIMVGLAKHPAVDNYDVSSLNMIISGAAPLSGDIEQAVSDRIDGHVKQAWGMSELSPVGLLNSDYNAKRGSVGPLVSSTYGKVVDIETGKSLGPNESGELMIKGPQVMMGYLDAPDATAECLSKDGWLRTGDIAHYDEEGFFFITDRLKELVKVRGFAVAPAELEALLLTNEHVSDAAVVRVKDDESGELPKAFVVLKGNDAAAKVTEDEIRGWVKERVAPFKRLDGGVSFVDAIPKSASGKILRRVLQEQVEENQ